MDFNYRLGYIEAIVGPMFAGKSEELIRRVKRIEYAKKKVICFKPEIDNRYSNSQIVSHNHHSTDSINIKSSNEILSYITEDTYAVVIDEAQFLDKGLLNVIDELASKGKRVIVAGLDMDFKGEPFGIMPQILAMAEFVTKLSAICVKCGAPATRTQRIIDGHEAYYDDPIVFVGAKESYEARCRMCHFVPRKHE